MATFPKGRTKEEPRSLAGEERPLPYAEEAAPTCPCCVLGIGVCVCTRSCVIHPLGRLGREALWEARLNEEVRRPTNTAVVRFPCRRERPVLLVRAGLGPGVLCLLHGLHEDGSPVHTVGRPLLPAALEDGHVGGPCPESGPLLQSLPRLGFGFWR